MFVQRETVTVTTASDGSATAFTTGVFTGRIQAITYTKTSFADGSTITITSETTGQTIWVQTSVNATATVSPRQPTHSTAGVAALYAAAGTAVNDHIFVANERIKIVIASGGNVAIGAFTFIIS